MRIRGGHRDYGRYNKLGQGSIPEEALLAFDDFSGGYNSSQGRHKTPPNASFFSQDMEVDDRGYLVRAPGTSVVEAIDEDFSVIQMITHVNLDNRAELLLFAPPYIGIKIEGGVNWFDYSLDESARYAYTNFGGTLIFSNGRGAAKIRQPESTTVEENENIPPARAYMTFANRVFALYTIIEGNMEPLGVRWSSANSDYTDWGQTDQLGAGDELLINDMTAGDRIICGRPMGFDFAAIINRNSIWIARRTGLRDRPADFQPRVTGVGAINEAVCQTSRFGVILLSDTGVYLFDGNTATMVSGQINSDLLPLNYEDLDQYHAVYNPTNKCYYLHTPTETWVWDIEDKRWYRRSLVSSASTIFAEQFSAPTWGEMVGNWEDQTAIWSDLSPEQGEARLLFLNGQLIHQEDSASTQVFDEDFVPVWEFAAPDGARHLDLMTVKGFYYRYVGSGTVRFKGTDNNGDLQEILEETIVGTVVPRTRYIPALHTGLGGGLSIEIVSGTIKTVSIQAALLPRSQRIETV